MLGAVKRCEETEVDNAFVTSFCKASTMKGHCGLFCETVSSADDSAQQRQLL